MDLAAGLPGDRSASSDNDEDFVSEDEEQDTDAENSAIVKITKEEDALTTEEKPDQKSPLFTPPPTFPRQSSISDSTPLPTPDKISK
nr:uncharacterized protein CTRU02_05532 [Colletotrichum truncatum]KAF6793975.1 hypothetical protein CTRU02_05532 [Colletotrichum truncatum]